MSETPEMPVPSRAPLRVAVVGAGSIGCHLGGRLASNPAVDVTLVGRPAMAYAVQSVGLTVGSPGGPVTTISPERLTATTELNSATATDTDIVLVTVKAKDTETVGSALAATLPRHVPVLCLQNGLHGTARLAAAMPDHTVLAGMVPFNVVHEAPATYLRMTSGDVMVDDHPALRPLIAAAGAAGLTLIPRLDMPAVHAAKLLLNLNNAVNALSGLPLKAELSDRDFRRVLAASQREALTVYAAHGLSPARLTPLPPALMTRVLTLPTPVFTLLARAALSIDPKARSSMADDLDLFRPTEVADLQGEIARMGRERGIPTPLSDSLVRLVRDAERAGAERRRWTGSELLAEVSGDGAATA